MTDLYIKIEMVGDDRHLDGSLMERLRAIIREFGTVEHGVYSARGVVQSFEASVTVPNPAGLFGDRDVMADYRLDG
jgi:hypothetical protein